MEKAQYKCNTFFSLYLFNLLLFLLFFSIPEIRYIIHEIGNSIHEIGNRIPYLEYSFLLATPQTAKQGKQRTNQSTTFYGHDRIT